MDYLNESKLFMGNSHAQFFSDGSSQQINRDYLIEHKLSVYIDGQKAYEIICTDTCIKELAIGRLADECIIGSMADIESIECSDDDSYVSIRLKKDRKASDRVHGSLNTRLNHTQIFNMIEAVNSDMYIHQRTSGTHICYLFRKEEKVCACEDIGRHNALDKVIGHMLLENISPDECVIFTTGRVPLDMIKKVAAVSVPTIITKSVPTLQAVEFAKQNGIQLISRAWPDSFEINYTGESR